MDTNDIMFAQLEAEQEAILEYIEEAYTKYAGTNVINKAIADCVDKLFIEKFNSLKNIIENLQDKNWDLLKREEKERNKKWELEKKVNDLERQIREINFNNSKIEEITKKYKDLQDENENLKDKIIENLKDKNICQENNDFSEYDKRLYEALIAGGVEDWDGYEFAIERLEKEIIK